MPTSMPPARLWPDMKKMSGEEFLDLGYLQEVNRQFFHPLGLALTIGDESGRWELVGIRDERDDPGGLCFTEVDATKAANLAAEWERRAAIRLAALGYVVQPVP